MQERRKMCTSENGPISAIPKKLPFFKDEIYQLFSYSYVSKVPKWKCAHILPPDWIQRKKKTPCISISVTFWWLWLPLISVDLLFLPEIHLWFCSLCCILKVGYFVIPILCLQSAQTTKVGPKVSQVLHICHPLLPVPLYLQREDTVHRT